MRAHCWLQWEAKGQELNWMLLLTQGLIHRDVHWEVELKLLHRGKDKVTVTCSYLDPVVFVYSTYWHTHTHSVKPHTPPNCEQLQNESPELLYSWQAAHYRRNTENLTFIQSNLTNCWKEEQRETHSSSGSVFNPGSMQQTALIYRVSYMLVMSACWWQMAAFICWLCY